MWEESADQGDLAESCHLPQESNHQGQAVGGWLSDRLECRRSPSRCTSCRPLCLSFPICNQGRVAAFLGASSGRLNGSTEARPGPDRGSWWTLGTWQLLQACSERFLEKTSIESDQAHMVRRTPLVLPSHIAGKGFQFFYSPDLHPTPTFLSVHSSSHSPSLY